MTLPKKGKKEKKKTNSSSNIDPTLFANSCTRFDWVRFATRKKKKKIEKKEREGKRNLTGRGGRRDTVYFYRSPSAGIFLFDGKYSWRRTVHARFVTARILPTALKSLDKFYDVSLRAFFPFFRQIRKRRSRLDCRIYVFTASEISNPDYKLSRLRM